VDYFQQCPSATSLPPPYCQCARSQRVISCPHFPSCSAACPPSRASFHPLSPLSCQSSSSSQPYYQKTERGWSGEALQGEAHDILRHDAFHCRLASAHELWLHFARRIVCRIHGLANQELVDIDLVRLDRKMAGSPRQYGHSRRGSLAAHEVMTVCEGPEWDVEHDPAFEETVHEGRADHPDHDEPYRGSAPILPSRDLGDKHWDSGTRSSCLGDVGVIQATQQVGVTEPPRLDRSVAGRLDTSPAGHAGQGAPSPFVQAVRAGTLHHATRRHAEVAEVRLLRETVQVSGSG